MDAFYLLAVPLTSPSASNFKNASLMPSVVWDEKRFSAVLRLLRESMFLSENRLEPFAWVAARDSPTFDEPTSGKLQRHHECI